MVSSNTEESYESANGCSRNPTELAVSHDSIELERLSHPDHCPRLHRVARTFCRVRELGCHEVYDCIRADEKR